MKSNHVVLDAGCGPGSITASVARLVPGGRVVGVDASAGVIDEARLQADLPSNVSFEVANILHLPYAEETFDVVFTSQVLIHVPDACAAVAELRRVCKQRGIVACREAHIAATLLHPEHPGLLKWRAVLEEILCSAKAKPSAATELMRWMLDAGFAASQIKFSTGAITYAGEERRWYGETTAARMMEDEAWRGKAVTLGLASAAHFALMRDGFLAMAQDDAGVYSMPCEQVVGIK